MAGNGLFMRKVLCCVAFVEVLSKVEEFSTLGISFSDILLMVEGMFWLGSVEKESLQLWLADMKLAGRNLGGRSFPALGR